MGKSFFLSGSFAIRIGADCIAEIMFSPSKSQRQGMDVPLIVSMWPFSNAQHQALHASVVLCSHKFSDASKSEDESTLIEKSRTSKTVGQEIPGKGTKVGGSKPFHTVHLSGLILPPALSALAELLCALSEVKVKTEANGERKREAEGELKAGADGVADAGDVSCEDTQLLYNTLSVEGEHRTQQGMSGSATDATDHHSTHHDDSSTLSLTQENPIFKSSSLHNIDRAFLHQNALSRIDGHRKKNDSIHPTENVGAAAAALLSASAEAVLKPKIPMKFSIKLVDPSSRYSSSSSTATSTLTSNDGQLGLKIQIDNPTKNSNSSSNSSSSNNSLSLDSINGAEKGVKGTLSWGTRKRAQEVPYFIVRTKSSTNTTAL